MTDVQCLASLRALESSRWTSIASCCARRIMNAVKAANVRVEEVALSDAQGRPAPVCGIVITSRIPEPATIGKEPGPCATPRGAS